MTASRWEVYRRCGDCGAAAGRACRTDDDSIASEPCAWRTPRKLRGRQKGAPRRVSTNSELLIKALKALDENARLTRTLIEELKHATQKEG